MPLARLAGTTLGVGLAVFLAACGTESGGPDPASSSEEGRASIPFVLASEPTFTLGGIEVPPAEQFSSLRGVAVLPDGSFWVADWQTRELRRFDRYGVHAATAGGAGDGPGEFRNLELVGLGPADSLFILDQELGRLTVLTADGEVGRTEAFFSLFELPLHRASVLEDRSIVAEVTMPIRIGAMEVGELTPDSGAIVRIEYPSVDTIGWYRSTRSIYTGGRPASEVIRFTSHDDLAVSNGRVLASAGPDFAVRDVIGDSVIFSVSRARRAVDQALLDDIRAEFNARYDDPEVGRSVLARIENQREHLPAHVPGYDRILVASSGRIWARPWAAGNSYLFGGYPRPSPDLWDVFAPTGRYLGQVETPGRLDLLAVGPGFILGSRIDDFGVVSLERFDFRER